MEDYYRIKAVEGDTKIEYFFKNILKKYKDYKLARGLWTNL